MRYDEVISRLVTMLEKEPWFQSWPRSKKLIINRDVRGRIALVIPKQLSKKLEEAVMDFARVRMETLQPWVYPVAGRVFKEEMLPPLPIAPQFQTDRFPHVVVVERLLHGNEWATVAKPRPNRLVFFSVKGGVGRSAALAATAWHLASKGKRVLVIDMDFQAPGVSANLLPPAQMPELGLVDWLMEAVAGNEKAIHPTEVSNESPLAANLSGTIRVVPAYGRAGKDYVAKMGRIFLPETDAKKPGIRSWTCRLEEKILKRLEKAFRSDLILFDSRAGIDDTAAAVVTNLGAKVLLFALDSAQTWQDYGVLFDCWNKWGKVQDIREHLQMVAGLVPPKTQASTYLERFTQHAYDLFLTYLYDEVPPGQAEGDWFSFDLEDDEAPHHPWPVYWHEGLMALQEFHTMGKDKITIEAAYGTLFRKVSEWLKMEEE